MQVNKRRFSLASVGTDLNYVVTWPAGARTKLPHLDCSIATIDDSLFGVVSRNITPQGAFERDYWERCFDDFRKYETFIVPLSTRSTNGPKQSFNFQVLPDSSKRDTYERIRLLGSPTQMNSQLEFKRQSVFNVDDILSSPLVTQPQGQEIDEAALSKPDDTASVSELHLERHQSIHNGNTGESRLRVKFISYGRIDPQNVQRFGQSGFAIPDGLCGTHEMYDQHWKFEIEHEAVPSQKLVLITWRITNLTSGTVTSMKESLQQASIRALAGRTVCNKVVKMALSSRARELEASLSEAEGTSRYDSIRNAAAALRPKMCTVGLLFFGLLHEAVQSRFGDN